MTDDFYVGALCALAVVEKHDGDDCHVYRDIVTAFGLSALLRVAKKEDDSQLPALLRLRAERRARRRSARSPRTEEET